MDINVVSNQGARQLAELGARFKAVGAVTARRELLRGLRAVAAPAIPAVQAAARAQLPKGGGLNEQVAGQKVTTTVRLTGKNVGVRISTTAPDTAQTNSGYVRHPLPRNRRGKGQWYTEQIPNARGWWTGTLTQLGPAGTAEMLRVQARIAQMIKGGML